MRKWKIEFYKTKMLCSILQPPGVVRKNTAGQVELYFPLYRSNTMFYLNNHWIRSLRETWLCKDINAIAR